MSDVLDFAKKAVPWITAAATGNVPALITMAAEAVGRATGVSIEPTKEAVLQAVGGATQAELLAMKAEEDNFALKMQEFGYKQSTELEASEVADRDSARKRESEIKDNVNRNLAYAVVGAFIMMVGATLLGFAKVESVLAGTLVGYLSAKCEQILAYYYGANRSTERHTELLAQSTPPIKKD